MNLGLQGKTWLASVVSTGNKIIRVLLRDVQGNNFTKNLIRCHGAKASILADGGQLHFLIS
jgi:hypothetical protein